MHYLREVRHGDLGDPRSTRAERFVVESVTIEADVPLANAADGLLGAVLRCFGCGQQIGPVRSSEEASVEIVGHLARDHKIAVQSALCARLGCRNIRHSGDLCRGCASALRRQEKRRRQRSEIEAQIAAARARIAAEIGASR
jgi:hypothetical protein